MSGTGRATVGRTLARLERGGVTGWPMASANRVFGRLLTPTRSEVEPGVSLLLDPRDLVSAAILASGEWQPGVWQSIASGLFEGAVFFDVGAHIGYDSLKASLKVGRSGQVVAFEPNPNTLRILRENIAASHAGNVTVQAIACTDREQALTLFDSTPEHNSGGSSLALRNADEQARGALPSYNVRGRPIDDVFGELGLKRLDVMKVDVEGAEHAVLLGAKETLRQFHPKLVVEIRAEKLAGFQVTPKDVESLLRSLGYTSARKVDDDDWEWTAK